MELGGYITQAKIVCLSECKYRNENSLKPFFCFHRMSEEDTYTLKETINDFVSIYFEI